MALRIRLVEPAPAGHNVYDLALLPRLGLPLMGKMLSQKGHDVRIYCELLAPVDLADCLSADLVGISSTTATAPAAYALADLLADAGVAVVLGGPHVTFCAEEALAHAPYVVRGEGEATMLELVACLEDGHTVARTRGLSFVAPDGEPHHNPDRARCTQEEFERLPNPGIELIQGHQRMKTKPVMTQWGCPFDCEFCSVTAMFSRSVRRRRTDQVLSELADLQAERVFFHDDNFVVNKARSIQLLRSMLSSGLTPEWFAQVRAETALRSLSRPEPDHDFLALMHQSGCRFVMVGVEAATEEGLAQIGKRQHVATVVEAVRAFHAHDIAVHGMFVAGLDTDTAASTEVTAAFAKKAHIDTFQLMVETPLPGTKLWDRVSGSRLLTEDWTLYDGHHVVMRPAQMTPLELQVGVLKAMRRFYSWPTILRSGVARVLHRAPDFTTLARPRLAWRLPALARAAWARHWDDIAPMLDDAFPPEARAQLASALWVPALRFYARRQLSVWLHQDRSREHIAFLRSLG